ncbi:HAD hydrolase-like protein [uncultured Amphritea sp.]|uniref:HAD hydrolase-like protein n=1 Tax=uncultured Amphritea sp. TaxID=981605 RepID=UPI002602CBB3|nr:HAD hydrolase-like protein [uncultured Amphritea sp.]
MNTVFFDLDGTLLDSQRGIAESIQNALAGLGYPQASPEQLQRCFGPPIRDSFARLMNTAEVPLIEDAVIRFRQHYLKQGIRNYTVYPGIRDLLQQLSDAGLRLRVLTVKPQPQAEWLLQDAQLAKLFEAVHGSELSGGKSDKTEHLGELIKHHPQPYSAHWMIGDRESDIRAARAHGLSSVAVTWGYGEAEELNGSNSDHLIHEPAALLDLLIR